VSALFAPLRLAMPSVSTLGFRREVRASPARDERTACRPFGLYLFALGDPNAKALGYFRIREVPTSDAQKWPEMFAKPIAHQRAVLAILVSQVFAPLNMTG